jgi:hypothetical protein
MAMGNEAADQLQDSYKYRVPPVSPTLSQALPSSPMSHRVVSFITAALLLAACEGDGDAPGTLPELPPPVVQPLPEAGPPRDPARLILTLVGEVRGEIDPCGCPSLPMGGFERRAGLHDELSAEGLPVFQLDAGNLLVEGYATGGRGDVRDRARLLMDLSAEVGLDVFCPGAADLLVLDPTALHRSFSERGIAAVSATWLDLDGQALLPPATVIERDGVRVGVIGLSAQPRDSAWRDRIRFRDPVLAAREAAASLPEDLQLIVGLSNLSDDENNRVASQVEQLAAILSIRNEVFDEPRSREQAVVIEVPNRGRYLSVVRLRTAAPPDRRLELDATRRLDLETHDHIEFKRLRLERRGEQLGEQELKTLAEHQARLMQQASGRNLAYVEAYPLGTRYAGDPETSRRIEDFKSRVLAQEVQARAEERRRPKGPPRYVSGARCFPCHTEQYSRWALTGHTKAYESLLERGEESNPECLTCHSTGFAVEGGWAEIAPSNILAFKAVQCEMCHGPLEGHPDDSAVRPRIPDEQTCLACHDEANSPHFDYVSYLPRAVCTVPDYQPEPLDHEGDLPHVHPEAPREFVP